MISQGTPSTSREDSNNSSSVNGSGPGKRRKVSTNQPNSTPQSSRNNNRQSGSNLNKSNDNDHNEDEDEVIKIRRTRNSSTPRGTSSIQQKESTTTPVPPPYLEEDDDMALVATTNSGKSTKRQSRPPLGKIQTPIPQAVRNDSSDEEYSNNNSGPDIPVGSSVKRQTLPSRTPQQPRSATRLAINNQSKERPTRTTVTRAPNHSLSPVKTATTTNHRHQNNAATEYTPPSTSGATRKGVSTPQHGQPQASYSSSVRSSPRLHSKPHISYSEDNVNIITTNQQKPSNAKRTSTPPPSQLQEEDGEQEGDDAGDESKPLEPEPPTYTHEEEEPEIPIPTPEQSQKKMKQKKPVASKNSKGKLPANTDGTGVEYEAPPPRQTRNTDSSIVLNLKKVPVNAGGTKRVNAIDVVSQIILEILSGARQDLESPWVINAFTQYTELVEQRFGKLIDAVDVNNSLSKAVKRAETKRNNLRLELLELRQQRTSMALEMQKVREEYQTDKEEINKLRDISSFVNGIQGLKEMAKPQEGKQATASKTTNHYDMDSLMIDIVKLDPIISGENGVLERIQSLSKKLQEIDSKL